MKLPDYRRICDGSISRLNIKSIETLTFATKNAEITASFLPFSLLFTKSLYIAHNQYVSLSLSLRRIRIYHVLSESVWAYSYLSRLKYLFLGLFVSISAYMYLFWRNDIYLGLSFKWLYLSDALVFLVVQKISWGGSIFVSISNGLICRMTHIPENGLIRIYKAVGGAPNLSY
ncbi:unnamed protein product [Acanthosepion pharaonis]|uniref:Uncharacterized protein n=1 Tax=Acanthosepion pharaonis TaxID=158019 RepID=A0A812ECG8_ACAPH|nr:unnamed protein product [Sepia pharaonis]